MLIEAGNDTLQTGVGFGGELKMENPESIVSKYTL